MSTLKVLEEYLVGNGGYLLNDDNNGKTVMLSGAWGSGKTHFWLEDIKAKLTDKKQKNIYISLYGRESIHELKFEVLKEAYNLEVKNDIISKSASMLSTIAPSLGEKSLVDGFDKLNKKAKEKKAEEILKSGSIICLDDFERKSKNIDLNDLFGYISQLALDYHCKVVIILNSDVFEGEEANVFKTVKEKTVNKFFYFEPTPEELFKSIFYSKNKDKKYKYICLRKYKTEILKAIKETEELNARIYIQVLDNCLEWIEKGYEKNVLRALVLNSICFMLNHFILSYPKFLPSEHESNNKYVSYAEINYSPEIKKYFNKQFTFASLGTIAAKNKIDVFIENLKKYITGGISNDTIVIKDNFQKDLLDQIKNKELEINVILKYGYQIFVAKDIDQNMYNQISNFIKTGILSPKEDNI